MNRRTWLTRIGCAALAPATLPARSVWAQESFPSRPIKIVIGFGPGSGTDILTRMLAGELTSTLGQPVVVENRPGAAAQIAATLVAKSPADGYTLFLTSNSSHSVNPHLMKSLPYDPIADFTPIGGAAYFPFVLAVNASLPIRTPQEFVAYARQNRGKLNYAYGTPTVQIPAEALNRLLGLEATGVSYKSSPAAMTDVIGGQAQFLVVDLASARAHIQSGKIRPLAVTTARRTSLAPDLPTIEESLGLKDFDLAAWTGVFGPANLPMPVVNRLSSALMEVLARPKVRELIIAAGAEPTPSDAETFRKLVVDQLDLWGKKIADAGMTAQ
jgi:tripartite-type tricarboxylate transporter receptor subunit TctC